MCNLVRKNLPALTWTTVILLCKCTTGQPEVKLEPCDGDRIFEVLNNTAGQNLTLHMDSMIPRFEMVSLYWNLRTARGQYIHLGRCEVDYFIAPCRTNHPRVFNLSLLLPNATLGVSSTLTVSTVERSYNLSGSFFDNGTALFGNSSVYIDILSPFDIFQRPLSCITDFIDLAQGVHCLMSYNTSSSPWSVNSRCDVTKVYSALGRYKCQLMAQTVGEPVVMGTSVLMTTHYVDNGPYVSGYCTISSEFPVSSGNYTYSVEITPGKKKYVVNFMGRPEISIPFSAILEHDCPTYVIEGNDVTCTCRSAQNVLGSPQGYVHWVSSGSERLSLTRVQRNSSAVQDIQCRLVWNGQIITSVNYSFEVRWPPLLPTHNCPISVSEGTSWTCRCDVSDAGHPSATVFWQQTGSASLALTNISRHDNGRMYKCLVVWDGSEFDSVTYPLSVQYTPSADSLSHNCPPYVTEGSTLDCSCVTSDAGNPPATLSWGGPMKTSQPDRLLRHNVQRDDEGVTMTCRMTWDDVLITSVNYTILVFPDASAALARGVGIGLGVGVALMAVSVAVLLLVLWRRGWELVMPCANRKGTTHTERKAGLGFKRPFVFDKRQKSDQLNSADPAYEAVDASKIGVASSYETLQVHSAPPVSRKKNKRTRKGGGSNHDNAAANLDFMDESSIPTKVYPGNSGAETYENVTTSGDKAKGKKKRTAESDSSVYVIS